MAIPEWVTKTREFETGRRLAADHGEYGDMHRTVLRYIARYGRWPRDGEVWGYGDLVRDRAEFWPREVRQILTAWERRFPGVECPLKYDDGWMWFYERVFTRQAGPTERYSLSAQWNRSDGRWEVPEVAWYWVLLDCEGVGLDCCAVRFKVRPDSGWGVEPAEHFKGNTPIKPLLASFEPKRGTDLPEFLYQAL